MKKIHCYRSSSLLISKSHSDLLYLAQGQDFQKTLTTEVPCYKNSKSQETFTELVFQRGVNTS